MQRNYWYLLLVLPPLIFIITLSLNWRSNFDKLKNETVFCTQDAKICPDGSAVGRIGPNCDFAVCPLVDMQKELQDCLPKSDVASKEKCQDLLGNTLDKYDLIRLDLTLPGSRIASPLKLSGKARGNWFFEASFPIVLVDWDGRIIAETHATAEGDWMTTDFVPFSATLVFTKPDTSVSNRGALILRKDNPSGLPENDDALELPVFFE